MKIAWISDFDFKGSGYFNISIPLADGLAKLGHDVKAAGLNYTGIEHYYDFSIIPANNMNEVLGIVQNLYGFWKFDVLVVAIDIPYQERILSAMPERPFKYVGIMPIEADPLCFSWAGVLMGMDKVFVISEFGANEAKKMGIEAEHIEIGIDTKMWRIPTSEEKLEFRKAYNIAEDEFVVLTVADNQERKNLSSGMEMFAEFSKNKKVRYILVTREHISVGWKLIDYAQELRINQKFMILERGMPFMELWALYALSDCFLLTSKAEGLGMILLEAMATGIPIVATDCTAISELLANNRGFLIKPSYIYRDPFGNGKRYLADLTHGVELLNLVYAGVIPDTIFARRYVEERFWNKSVKQLNDAIMEFDVEGNNNSQNTE